MTRRQPICAVVTLLLLPTWSWAADTQGSQPGKQAPDEKVLGDQLARTNGDPVLLTTAERYSEWNLRFGWWAFWNNGSPQKVGEYQDLKPSPFWDVDGFTSDGTTTVGVTATGSDNETTQGKLYYYQRGVTIKADYDRFLHRPDHDPLNDMPDLLSNFPPSGFDGRHLPNNPGGSDPLIMKQDLNVGQDYALRVQEIKASVKWFATDNLKARVDVWGMEKEGTRQNNSAAMCYNRNVSGAALPPDHLMPDGSNLGTFTGGRCHILSQAQHIDWMTTEIKPVIEVRLGDSFTVEYSRPMRGFTADDQTASRFYNVTGSLTYNPTTSNNTPPNDTANAAPYATGVVANSYTEMDQLKISGQISENTRAYAFLMAGHTVNQEIDMTRWFNNADMRLTNTSIENTTITGYGKIFNEAEQMPSLANVTALEHYNNTRTKDFEPELDHPINYHKSTAGLKGVWRVRGNGFDRGGLAIIGGYEYGDLERTDAIFTSDNGLVTLDDSRTITHSFQVGPDYRWSSTFDTYLRYKYQNADQPLIGFKAMNGLSNTLLPQNDHIVEVGFNWVPADWFLFNACVGIETSDTHGSFSTGDARPPINFNEQNYPMTLSAWYAVSDRLSLSAGYAVYSNFVAQDITVGDDRPGTTVAPVTGRWNYGGRAQVVTLGSRYAATERVALTGQVEWVRGHNLINNSTMLFPNAITVTDLGTYSEVLNESTRLTVGADWVIRPRIITYCRYELYNFNDMAPGYQTGLAQGVLGGFSALF